MELAQVMTDAHQGELASDLLHATQTEPSKPKVRLQIPYDRLVTHSAQIQPMAPLGASGPVKHEFRQMLLVVSDHPAELSGVGASQTP